MSFTVSALEKKFKEMQIYDQQVDRNNVRFPVLKAPEQKEPVPKAPELKEEEPATGNLAVPQKRYLKFLQSRQAPVKPFVVTAKTYAAEKAANQQPMASKKPRKSARKGNRKRRR